jgi:hypothetical protein
VHGVSLTEYRKQQRSMSQSPEGSNNSYESFPPRLTRIASMPEESK